MSLVLPPFYHWSPRSRRDRIIRSGLRPSTPTLVERFADEAVGDPPLRPSLGYETARSVCLGLSPSHAWSLSGALMASRGSRWDLWQVVLEDTDEVIAMPFQGHRLEEVRVLNRIPKSQVWHVGTRVVGPRRWSHA